MAETELKKCGRCGGTGKVKKQPGLGLVYEWVDCRPCNGTGWVRV